VQSVPVTGKAVNSIPWMCIRYNFIWKFLSVTWEGSPGTPVSSTDKTDCHRIMEILLKLVLYTGSILLTQFWDLI
jgi:hypothetical protein